jgi:hypothetical protein
MEDSPAPADVDLHGALGVDGEALVGIDGDTEETRVGVDELVLVPDHGVPQDTSIVEIGQAGHVVGAVKLGRVDLANLVSFENFFLGKKETQKRHFKQYFHRYVHTKYVNSINLVSSQKQF